MLWIDLQDVYFRIYNRSYRVSRREQTSTTAARNPQTNTTTHTHPLQSIHTPYCTISNALTNTQPCRLTQAATFPQTHKPVKQPDTHHAVATHQQTDTHLNSQPQTHTSTHSRFNFMIWDVLILYGTFSDWNV